MGVENDMPADWNEYIFSDAVEVNPNRQLKKGENAPFIEMKALNPNYRIVEKIDKTLFKGGGSRFRNGDTLFARITPCLEHGKIAYINKLEPEQVGHGSTEFIVMSGKEGITDNLFVYYLSRWDEIRNFAIKNMTGTSGRQRVPNNIFKQKRIKIPDIAEQRRIASILGTLDDKIELNHEMNRTLEEMAQAIFKHWFVDFEFPDENGKPYKSSGGEMVYSEELDKDIPKGWKVGVLNDVLSKIESGNRPKGGVAMYSEGIPSIGAENILGLGKYDYSKNKFVPLEFFNKMKTGIIRSGDVLLYKDGAKLGRKSLFMDGFPFEKCCINEHIFILRTNKKISPTYLYFWLDQQWITDEIKNLNTGSAQPGINQKGVNSLKTLIPPKDIIEKFNRTITLLIKRIFKNSLENQTLSQLRDTLLPKLLSGEIRINIDYDNIKTQQSGGGK